MASQKNTNVYLEAMEVAKNEGRKPKEIGPRGTFYQKTGGKWIYVVSPSGDKAVKREIRIGRQNPQYYEVLEGLEPGEKVITSGYDNFGDNEVLIF